MSAPEEAAATAAAAAEPQNPTASPAVAEAAPDASSSVGPASHAVLLTHQLVSASFQSAVSWFSSATSALGHFVEEAVAAEDAQAARQEREEAEASNQSGAAALSEASPIDPTAAPLDYTVTPALLEFVDALSEHDDTFLRFPRAHQSFRLSGVQEAHARSVLAASPALARMRYRLAPSQIKEHEFWRIYFILFANVARKIKATSAATAAAAVSTAECNCGLAAVSNANGEVTGVSHAASCPQSAEVAQHQRRDSAASVSSSSSSAVASPARPSADDAAVDSSASSSAAAAAAASSTPVSAIPLDLREADRLCGLDHMHDRRSSSQQMLAEGLSSDADDDDESLDPQTDALIADILRRQRLGSNSLPPPQALHSMQQQQHHTPVKSRASALSADFASDSDALNSSELGVTEAELDEALQLQQGDTPASPVAATGHARADSLAVSSAAELP